MFKHLYAPALSSYGTSAFWQWVVLQASDSSEAIKHLVIAASELHHAPSGHGVVKAAASRRSVPFLAHYGRALQVLSRGTASDIVVVLVACVLLAVCDDLQQDSAGAQRHIQAGQKILASKQETSRHGRWEHTAALNEIASSISRLCAPRPAMSHLHPLLSPVRYEAAT